MRRNQEMSTQQMDFMLSEAMLETRWMPLQNDDSMPINTRTDSGFLNTIPFVRMTVPLPITRKLTIRDYVEAFWNASLDHIEAWLRRHDNVVNGIIDNLEMITVCAFLLALLALVV